MAAIGQSKKLLFLVLLPLLAQGLPFSDRAASQQSAHQSNGPVPSSQHFAAPQQASFPSQAFASKLTGGLEASQQVHPQFVANNGPLIRTPDGQLVLAPAQQIPPHNQQQFGESFPGAAAVGQQLFIQQQQFGPPIPRQSAAHQQQPQFPQSFDSFPPQQQQFFNPPNVNNIHPNQPSTNASESANNTNSSSPSIPSTTTTAPPPPVDKSVDLDGDGVLSLNEVQYAAFVHHGLSSSVVENLFNEVDHNKDGFLTALEFNDIRPQVLAKAENAALRYLQNVDSDHNGLLSLQEAQAYILREYGISNRDVERIWRLVVPSSGDEMDAVLFSKLRRRVRGMSIRLARQIMKGADRDADGQMNLREAQNIAFEQEGIGPAEVIEMLASVDDNNDGQLNAPEFADFERIVRAKAVETSKKALKVVDTDGSNTLTMDEAKKIAFDHYGFDEATLEPFFAQADENEDGQLDAVEFAGFRSVIRGRAVKNAMTLLPEMDDDGDGVISEVEAEQRTRREDDMTPSETHGLFAVADQDKNELLDKVELADFVRLVRLTSIKFVADHFRDYDTNRDKLVTLDELERLVKDRYKLDPGMTKRFFDKVDVDRSGDLSPGEIVDFRHEVRRFTQDRVMQAELEEQNRREMAEIEQRLRQQAESKRPEEEKRSRESLEDDEETTMEMLASASTSTESTIAANSEEDVDEVPKKARPQSKNNYSITINENNNNNNTMMQAKPGNEDASERLKMLREQQEGQEEMLAKPEQPSTSSPPSAFANTSSSSPSTTQPVASYSNGTSAAGNGVQQQSVATTILPIQMETSPHAMAESTHSSAPIINPILATDSIGTTTRKQKKRRRKTTTPISTTTTPTTTTTTTEAATGESYEDDGEEADAEAPGLDEAKN